LEITEKFVFSLIEGTATYEEIVAEKSLEELLLRLDVDREFKIICEFPEFQMHSTVNEKGKEGIKNMLELFQCSHQIALIPKVCEQCDLTNCVNDKNLEELKTIVNAVSSPKDRAKITGEDATKHMKDIWEKLYLEDYSDSEAKRCLKIFPAIAKCKDFQKFIKGKKFTGEQGRKYFTSQLGLISAQLQHEDYNETVFNHLLPAFEYIAPFFDTNQTLSELMAKIVKLFSDKVGFGKDHKKDFCQLETVNSNITLIQLWFSRTEVSNVTSVVSIQ